MSVTVEPTASLIRIGADSSYSSRSVEVTISTLIFYIQIEKLQTSAQPLISVSSSHASEGVIVSLSLINAAFDGNLTNSSSSIGGASLIRAQDGVLRLSSVTFSSLNLSSYPLLDINIHGRGDTLLSPTPNSLHAKNTQILSRTLSSSALLPVLHPTAASSSHADTSVHRDGHSATPPSPHEDTRRESEDFLHARVNGIQRSAPTRDWWELALRHASLEVSAVHTALLFAVHPLFVSHDLLLFQSVLGRSFGSRLGRFFSFITHTPLARPSSSSSFLAPSGFSPTPPIATSPPSSTQRLSLHSAQAHAAPHTTHPSTQPVQPSALSAEAVFKLPHPPPA